MLSAKSLARTISAIRGRLRPADVFLPHYAEEPRAVDVSIQGVVKLEFTRPKVQSNAIELRRTKTSGGRNVTASSAAAPCALPETASSW